MTVLSAVLLFGFLVFIHELGHFILAKYNNVKVLKFSLGFGPKVIGKQIGDTEYLISAIPLGGYVKMLGEGDEEEKEEDETKISEAIDDERSYKNQNVLKRVSIVFAGPVFNLLTAVAIFFFIFLAGIPTLLPVVGDVMPGTPAAKAMLLKGDKIVGINGKPVSYWADMTDLIHVSANKPLSVNIQRKTETAPELITVSITPESKKVKDIFGEEKEIGLIGVKPSGDTVTVKESLPNSVKNAFIRTWDISVLTLVGMVKLVQNILPAETIGGPILIFQLAEKQATAGALSFFTFAAVISINLGVLNLLPIPVLDGGHILFLGIEAIRKKPMSEKVMLISQRIGMSLLLALMAFAMYNDIFRLISGKPLP